MQIMAVVVVVGVVTLQVSWSSMQVTMKQQFFIHDGTRVASFRYNDGVYNNVYVGHKGGWGQHKLRSNIRIFKVIHQELDFFLRAMEYFIIKTMELVQCMHIN